MKRTIEEVNAELAMISEEMAQKWAEHMGDAAAATVADAADGSDRMLAWASGAIPEIARLVKEKTMVDLHGLEGTTFDEIADRLGWDGAIRSHAKDSMVDADQYGLEFSIRTHSGREIRGPAYPQDCDYIRVCEAGFELAYWNMDEVRESPEEVIGAIMGAAHGQVAAPVEPHDLRSKILTRERASREAQR